MMYLFAASAAMPSLHLHAYEPCVLTHSRTNTASPQTPSVAHSSMSGRARLCDTRTFDSPWHGLHTVPELRPGGWRKPGETHSHTYLISSSNYLIFENFLFFWVFGPNRVFL